MGARRAEVWTQPETGTFVKRIAELPWQRVGFNRELNRISSGQVTVPAIYRRLSDIVNPATDAGSLIRIFEDGVNVASFYANDADFDESIQGTVTITGDGIESALEGGIIYPWDWSPGAIETLFPDWVYGVGNNEIGDPGFEDDPTYPLRNGDAEEGSTSGWSSYGSDAVFNVVNNPANAYEGNYFFQINPMKYHSGIKQSIRVYPGKRNQFSVKLKEPGATSRRFTFGVEVGEGYIAHGLNQFEYDETIMAELGNVASNGLGTPGGSSDGTWQDMQLDVTWGDVQEETSLFVQFDHHKLADGPEFWVDAVTMAGFGVGTGEWEPVGLEWLTTFEGSTEQAHSGTRSLKLVMNGVAQPLGGAGVNRRIFYEEGAPYFAEIWVRTPTAGTPTVRLAAEQADGSEELVAVTADLVQDTWTRLRLEFDPPEGIFEGLLTIAWDETTAGTLYIDDTLLQTGLAPATAGYILKEQLDLITTRTGGTSALTWLKYDSFNASTDSNGVAWPEELKIRVPRGQTVRQLLDQLNGWGYEWEIIWNDGAGQYELRFYTKYTGSSGGAGTTNSVKLTKGKSFRQGRVRLRDPGPNTFLGEGIEGKLFEKQDSSLATPYGRREGYIAKRDTSDNTTLESMIDNAIVESKNQRYGVKASLFARPLPILDFDLGSKINVDIPPQLPNDAYRVVGFTGAWDVKDGQSTYTLDFSSRVYEAPFGGTTSTVTSDGLNYLLGKFEPMPDIERFKLLDTGDGDAPKESVPTIMVAAYNSRQQVKNHADIVCNGVADEETIQVAIDEIQSVGVGRGRLQLSEGDFVLTNGAVVTVPTGMTIAGVGIDVTKVGWDQAGTPASFQCTGDYVNFMDFVMGEFGCS
jgi:hypothetical protein